MQGYGPTQIARIFTERGYDTPAIYNRKHGLPICQPVREDQDLRAQKIISDMTANMSYLGHMVNFKSYKKSYKSKKRYWNPKEDRAIFENTQEAIIDQATFDTVQKIREVVIFTVAITVYFKAHICLSRLLCFIALTL